MSVLSEMLLILSPLMLGYIVYTSIAYHTLSIILGAYLTVTLYTLWNIWPDEHLTLQQKIKMSAMSLYMYALFYAMDLVQIIAIFRCLKNYKSILLGTQGHATWVSPSRSSKQAAAI